MVIFIGTVVISGYDIQSVNSATDRSSVSNFDSALRIRYVRGPLEIVESRSVLSVNCTVVVQCEETIARCIEIKRIWANCGSLEKSLQRTEQVTAGGSRISRWFELMFCA